MAKVKVSVGADYKKRNMLPAGKEGKYHREKPMKQWKQKGILGSS